ncbi:neocarzinostatin apoprotein domain-containing protein [Micromonospora haikouensis]|uniref:neocarzinostatin apoprotein domain-containing protein n=1 Tax=Micromonospora haikouensis TaxID=686309 RepID=UPI0037989005
MRFRSWLSAVVLAAGVVAVSPPAPAASAQLDAAPSVTARPASGLSASSVVRVTATGLPRKTEVAIVQCDTAAYDDGSRIGCPVVHTATTSGLGRISERVNVSITVYRSRPYGDDEPVYCRADICRFFVEWVVDGDRQSVATAALEFTGDPATITATPNSGLVDGQPVEVTGTAKGSPSRYVTIIQTACYDIIQGSGCFDDTPLATVPLTEDDTFTTSVNVRYWPSCAPDDFMTTCELHVVVYDAQGQPDGSFGSGWSGPHSAYLGFAPVV